MGVVSRAHGSPLSLYLSRSLSPSLAVNVKNVRQDKWKDYMCYFLKLLMHKNLAQFHSFLLYRHPRCAFIGWKYHLPFHCKTTHTHTLLFVSNFSARDFIVLSYFQPLHQLRLVCVHRIYMIAGIAHSLRIKGKKNTIKRLTLSAKRLKYNWRELSRQRLLVLCVCDTVTLRVQSHYFVQHFYSPFAHSTLRWMRNVNFPTTNRNVKNNWHILWLLHGIRILHSHRVAWINLDFLLFYLQVNFAERSLPIFLSETSKCHAYQTVRVYFFCWRPDIESKKEFRWNHIRHRLCSSRKYCIAAIRSFYAVSTKLSDNWHFSPPNPLPLPSHTLSLQCLIYIWMVPNRRSVNKAVDVRAAFAIAYRVQRAWMDGWIDWNRQNMFADVHFVSHCRWHCVRVCIYLISMHSKYADIFEMVEQENTHRAYQYHVE